MKVLSKNDTEGLLSNESGKAKTRSILEPFKVEESYEFQTADGIEVTMPASIDSLSVFLPGLVLSNSLPEKCGIIRVNFSFVRTDSPMVNFFSKDGQAYYNLGYSSSKHEDTVLHMVALTLGSEWYLR